MKDNLTCPHCTTVFRVPPKALTEVGRVVRCSQCKHAWHATAQDLHEKHEELFSALFAEEEAPVPIPTQPAMEKDVSFIDALLAVSPQEEDAEEESIVQENIVREDIFDTMEVETFPHSSNSVPPQLHTPFYTNIYVLCAANMVALLLLVCVSGLLWRVPITAQFPLMQRIYHKVGYENTDGLKLANITFSSTRLGKDMRYVVRGHMVNQGTRPYIVPSIRARLLTKRGELLEEWRLDNAPQKNKPVALLAVGAQKAFNLKLPDAYKDATVLALDIGSPFEIDSRK